MAEAFFEVCRYIWRSKDLRKGYPAYIEIVIIVMTPTAFVCNIHNVEYILEAFEEAKDFEGIGRWEVERKDGQSIFMSF